MNEQDRIYYTKRGTVDRIAQEIVDREIRINRATLGYRAARLHGLKIAADYQRREYERVERELLKVSTPQGVPALSVQLRREKEEKIMTRNELLASLTVASKDLDGVYFDDPDISRYVDWSVAVESGLSFEVGSDDGNVATLELTWDEIERLQRALTLLLIGRAAV